MTGVTVRPAAAADLQLVAAMVAALNAEEGDDRDKAADAAALGDAFLGAAPAGRLLVATRGEALLGHVTLHTTYETEFAARGCRLGDVFVTPEARRQGVGRALIAAAARAARETGGSFLWWTALPGNAGGQAFYRAIGAEGESLHAFALSAGAFARLADEAR